MLIKTSVETTMLGLPKLYRRRHEIQVKSFFHIQNYGYWNNIPYRIAYALQIGWDNNVGDQISYIAPILMKNISLFSEFNRDFNYVVRISVHWQLKNVIPPLDSTLSSTVSDLVRGRSIAASYVVHECTSQVQIGPSIIDLLTPAIAITRTIAYVWKAWWMLH